MGFERVELRSPSNLDPRPSWTLGDVLAELDALDATRQAATPTPLKQPPDWATNGSAREKAFVMRIDDEEDTDDEDESSDEAPRGLVIKGGRFSCNGLESSDSEESGDGLDGQVVPYHLMEKRNLEKCILLELENEHHLKVQMAGFALHKRYGSQFMKILDVISRCFLPALKDQGSKLQMEAVNNLQNYLNDKVYLEEPEGQYLAQQLLSKELFT